MNEEDEIIDVKLPRKDYELMRRMIEREEAFSWFTRMLSASFIWIVAGGMLSLILLWDKIQYFFGVR